MFGASGVKSSSHVSAASTVSRSCSAASPKGQVSWPATSAICAGSLQRPLPFVYWFRSAGFNHLDVWKHFATMACLPCRLYRIHTHEGVVPSALCT